MKSTGFKLVGALAVLAVVGFIYINSTLRIIPPLSPQSSSLSSEAIQLPTLASTVVSPREPSAAEATPTLAKVAEDKQESLAKIQPTYTPASIGSDDQVLNHDLVTAEPSETIVQVSSLPAGEDGQLVISKVDLSAEIVKVPIVDNQWLVEDLGADIGLLEGGGRFPGDEKSMILAGHATTFWPIKGPFAKLAGLIPNDEVIYIFEGQEYTYKISRLVWADPDNIGILNSDNGDQIILVTCGQYDYFVGRYDQRLIVLADLIDVKPIQAN